jgi:hypothetical protein
MILGWRGEGFVKFGKSTSYEKMGLDERSTPDSSELS